MNRIRFVVDASALWKGIADEQHSREFRAWIERARDANSDLLGPTLLRYEIGNCLTGQSGLDSARRSATLDRLLLGFRFADGANAFEHAPPLSFYDASYLSLAQSTKATLVSYDDKLLKAAKKAGIPTLSP